MLSDIKSDILVSVMGRKRKCCLHCALKLFVQHSVEKSALQSVSLCVVESKMLDDCVVP